MTQSPCVRACLCLLLLLATAAAAHAQPMSANGVITNAAPMYLAPDSSRVPLTTLAAGSNVKIVAREGDWLRVVFRDRYPGTEPATCSPPTCASRRWPRLRCRIRPRLRCPAW